MSQKHKKQNEQGKRINPIVFITAFLINIIAFVYIGYIYYSSDSYYNDKLFAENMQRVEDLNSATANAAYTYINGLGTKLDDIVSYIESNELTYQQTIDYLKLCNTNPDRQIQLIKSGRYGSSGALSFGDYTGLSFRLPQETNESFKANVNDIIYGSGYYDIFKSFTDVNDENNGGVCFTPEFADPDTKLKCFAGYHHITLLNDKGERILYTILLVVNSERAISSYNLQNKYSNQSSVLVNSNGDYIIKNNDYRNMNFFDYIVNYNKLTLDRKQLLLNETRENTKEQGSSANLFFKNHSGDDCVFTVISLENGWYSITCVPLSSFNLDDTGINYSLIIMLVFGVLFIIDALVIYMVGVTMRSNVEIAKKATREATEANLAKSRFLSTMSHELRTPLNAIIGLASLSNDSIDDPKVLRDYLKKIDFSSKLLLQLISDILDVSAIESNKMKLNECEFDMTRLITSLSAIYYDQCAVKGITFSVALKNMHSETLIGDSARVNQILLNFLSNAVKFTPSGGKVTLCAEQKERQDNRVVIRFTVTDNGCGINDELRKRLFLPFERAHGDVARKHSGSGLGLSISKNLAELMNGQVGVESAEGEGSNFWVDLPFQIPEKSTVRSFPRLENIRVLAAVADAEEREYIGRILKNFGVEYSLADSANSALSLLHQRKPNSEYNLLLLDWKLPDLSGIETARKIREEYNEESIRIVILAYNLAEASTLCMANGANTVLGKPVFASSLYNILAENAFHSSSAPILQKSDYGLNGIRVLLVEDNILNTEIAKLLLKKVGVEVVSAENGKLGVERFTASSPDYYDAVLMDVQMPVMDGYEATRQIRASNHPQSKTVPILAMTADAFAEDVEKAKNAGMNEHISKPIVPDHLYTVLSKYVSHEKE